MKYLLALCLLFPSIVFGVDGHLLKKMCNSNEDESTSLCMGYLMGSLDHVHHRLDSIEQEICPDDEVTTGHMMTAVKKFINENPQHLDLFGDVLVSLAIAESYPCE